MDGYFYARLAYEAFFANVKRKSEFDAMSEVHKENWNRAANAVLSGAAPAIEARAMQTTLPPLEFDPDSTPTPVEVPHPHGSK